MGIFAVGAHPIGFVAAHGPAGATTTIPGAGCALVRRREAVDPVGVIALRVRNQLRAHARGWLIWAVIVGVTAGIPLAALAGAHRTQTA